MRDWWVTYIDNSNRVQKELVSAATAVSAGMNWVTKHPDIDAGCIVGILLHIKINEEGMGIPSGPPP